MQQTVSQLSDNTYTQAHNTSVLVSLYCRDCGKRFPVMELEGRFAGYCPKCHAWNTFANGVVKP